jgi:hypothetical protein
MCEIHLFEHVTNHYCQFQFISSTFKLLGIVGFSPTLDSNVISSSVGLRPTFKTFKTSEVVKLLDVREKSECWTTFLQIVALCVLYGTEEKLCEMFQVFFNYNRSS